MEVYYNLKKLANFSSSLPVHFGEIAKNVFKACSSLEKSINISPPPPPGCSTNNFILEKKLNVLSDSAPLKIHVISVFFLKKV